MFNVIELSANVLDADLEFLNVSDQLGLLFLLAGHTASKVKTGIKV